MCLKQDRERKTFQDLMKQKMKQQKAELETNCRGQPKEVRQQRRAEQEAELAKKACCPLLSVNLARVYCTSY